MEELAKELFKQQRNDTPLPTTRWSQKRLFCSIYCRAVVKRKSLENTLRKALNWLEWMDLLPENIESYRKVRLRKYTKNLIDFYTVDNKHRYSIFF